jgi:hypothetical protein
MHKVNIIETVISKTSITNSYAENKRPIGIWLQVVYRFYQPCFTAIILSYTIPYMPDRANSKNYLIEGLKFKR